jgi:hypothetical protein
MHIRYMPKISNAAATTTPPNEAHAITQPLVCFDQNEFDAFELVARRESEIRRGDIYRADERSLTLTAEWNRPGEPLSVEDPVWSLTLDLVTPGHGNVGYLKLVRRYDEGNLLIDVNLLVSELQPALSKAVARILRSSSAPYSESFPLVEGQHRTQAAGGQS